MNQTGKVNLVCGQVNFWYARSRGKLLLQKNPRTLGSKNYCYLCNQYLSSPKLGTPSSGKVCLIPYVREVCQ